MSAIKSLTEELACGLQEIIEHMPPRQLGCFLGEIEHAVNNNYGNEDLTEDWWLEATFYDIALYCVVYGAYFDDVDVETYLCSYPLTKNIYMNNDMYGVNLLTKRWKGE